MAGSIWDGKRQTRKGWSSETRKVLHFLGDVNKTVTIYAVFSVGCGAVLKLHIFFNGLRMCLKNRQFAEAR